MSENRSQDGIKSMETSEKEHRRTLADVLRARLAGVRPSTPPADAATQKNKSKVILVDFSRGSTTRLSQPPARVNVEYEALKQHWRDAFRAFDLMIKSRPETIDQPIGDEVEKLRTDLEKRVKQEYGVKLAPSPRIEM